MADLSRWMLYINHISIWIILDPAIPMCHRCPLPAMKSPFLEGCLYSLTWTQAQEGLTSSQKQTWEKAFRVEGHRHGIPMAAIFVCSLGILSGWWFVLFFYFPFHIWDNPSHWLIFFGGVETTNQLCIQLSREFSGMIHWLTIKNHPSNPQQPIHSHQV